MQIIQSKQNIVEKILRDKEGRLVCAKFCIYEYGGRVKARLVDFKYLDEPAQIKGVVFSLIGSVASKASQLRHGVSKLRVVSPYFTFETLNFIGSKPRAPTL